ncbi:CU044_5270 family protein [Kineococcus sp. NBC_00420]|uniref:CU044_5270 family protein n=1 Tax=Kineococcus sp. NBC_00420 TaxID=2903564 RepID=UPI002E22556D
MPTPFDLDALAQQAGQTSAPTREQLEPGRRQLQQAIEQADTRVLALRRHHRQSKRRPTRRWTITALAGAAAAAAVALVLPVASAPPASAEQVLLVTAQAAGQQPDQAAGAAYWHVHSEQDYPATKPLQREIWQSRNGESVLRDETLVSGALDGEPVDPAEVVTTSLDGPAVFGVGGRSLSWADLDALPTDPQALGTLLRAAVKDHPAGEDHELFVTVTDLLTESPASPALRRALWEVAARVPGAEVLGPMTDAAGRTGTAIERDELDQNRYRYVYILDPTTGELLETRNVDRDGVVVYRMTELAQEPASTAPLSVPPGCGPGSVPEHSC